jgi:hypothetical protein
MKGTCLLLSLCGRQDIRFPERRLRFARILSNTLGFISHMYNIDWALRGNRSFVPFQPQDPSTD